LVQLGRIVSEWFFCILVNWKQECLNQPCFFIIKMKLGNFVNDLLNIIRAKFGYNWPIIFRGKDCNVINLQTDERSVMARALMTLQVRWAKQTDCTLISLQQCYKSLNLIDRNILHSKYMAKVTNILLINKTFPFCV
jgi:hypothetical protein